MSTLFGGRALLCDGCAIQIATLSPGATSDRAVMPGLAISIRASGWDDDGPDSHPRSTGESFEVHFVRHFCEACRPVALDKLREAFPLEPLVKNLAEAES
jgi:hypothetical protein